MLDLKAEFKTYKEEVIPLVHDVLDTQYFIGGRYITEFESALAKYSETKYACTCASGSDALIISLLAAGIAPGDEVITSPFTFFATAGAISIIGAKPVFTDVESDSFNIDPVEVKKRITTETKAIIAVDLYGQCADYSELKKISEEYKLILIADSAQSIGAEHKGVKVGSLGDMTITSFYPAKNLGAFGDAGAVLTNDEKLFNRLTILREHGSSDRYFHAMVGKNARMDAIQAAALSVKIKYLDEWTDARQKNAERYYYNLNDNSLREYITLPVVKDYSSRHVFNQFVVKTSNRDELKDHLAGNGISSAVFYPLGLHLQECFSFLGYKKGDFPVAEELCSQVLALPVFPTLGNERIDYVSEKILSYFGKR